MRELLAFFLCSFAASAGYSSKATVTFAAATGSTQNNITLAFSGADAKLRTIANGGQIQHTVARVGVTVPADFALTADSTCATTSGYTWGIESYNAATGSIKGWVLIPSLTTGAGVVPVICIGNSAVSTYQGGSQGAEFDSGTVGAWHLPDGSVLNTKDFSSLSNDATRTGVSAVAGIIGGGALFPVSGTPTVSAPIAATSAFTLTMWFSYRDNGSYYNGLYTFMGGSNGQNIRAANNGQAIYVYDQTGSGLGAYAVDLRDGAFHRLDLVYTATNSRLYFDGVSVFSTTGTYVAISAGTLALGSLFNISGDSWYGAIDEARLSNSARSAAWIATEYANQSSPPAISSFDSISGPLTGPLRTWNNSQPMIF